MLETDEKTLNEVVHREQKKINIKKDAKTLVHNFQGLNYCDQNTRSHTHDLLEMDEKTWNEVVHRKQNKLNIKKDVKTLH